MTGFLNSYKDVFDAVVAALATKTSIKTVVKGTEFRASSTLPAAIINPLQAPVAPMEMGAYLQVTVNFSVIVIIRETVPADWFTDIIPIMADVVDAMLADRTLGGKAQDCVPTGFYPGEITFQNKLFYGGAVSFQAVVYFTP